MLPAGAADETPRGTVVIDAPPFTVRAAGTLRHQAEMIASSAPALSAKVAGSLGLPAPTEGTLVVLGPRSDDDELQKLASGVPLWAAGVTLPSSQMILIRLDRIGGYGQREILSVLAHELAHLTLSQALPDHGREIPGWLGEGIASSAAHEGEWRDLWIVWTSPLVSSAHPFADLDAAMERGEESKSLAYAGSLAAAGFLGSRYGREFTPRLLAGLRSGLDFDAAFRQAAGVSLGEAERAWARDLNLPWIWVVRLGSSYTVWIFATLLILLAYAVKRARAKRVMDRWRDEEEPGGWRFDPPGAGGDDDETVH